MPAYTREQRDKIIAHCEAIGQPKLAARILFNIQQDYWKRTARLRKLWPEEEPSLVERIEGKIDRLQATIEKARRPREVVVYRDRPKPEETASKVIGFVP